MKKRVRVVMLLLIATLSYFIGQIAPTPAQQITLSIFVLAALLWITEVIPLYTTSVLVLVLLSTFLAPVIGTSANTFFAPFFSPVIALFLGGLVLAVALHKYGIDAMCARRIIKAAQGKPKTLIWLLLLTTAFLSMWMSNTAVAAVMLGVLGPVILAVKETKYRTSLVLAVAVGANVGGMATPIGSPPNAIAVGMLAEQGINLSFFAWMKIGLPIALLLLALAGIILTLRKAQNVDMPTDTKPITRDGVVVIGVAILTILGFIFSSQLGLSLGIIALFPVILYFGFGLLHKEDLKNIDWDVLLLIGGGLSLSIALQASQLSTWIVQSLGIAELGLFNQLLAFGILAFVLTNLISNTTTAAMLMPLAFVVFDNTVLAAYLIGLIASCSMLLPISTPPNALAYNTGHVSSKQMLSIGSILGLAALGVVITVLI